MMAEEFPDCPRWERCEPIICPADRGREKATWFPDEPICSRRDFAKLPWLRRQKLIQRRARNRDTYYTLAMLEAIDRVSLSIVGANPAKLDGDASWLRARRSKRPFSRKKQPATALR